MQTHFLSSLPGKYRLAYRNYYTQQNLIAIRSCCLIFFVVNLVFRIGISVLPENLSRAQNFPEFNASNWIYLVVTPFFYLFDYLLLRQYEKTKKATMTMIFFVFIFSFYMLMAGMFTSFISTSDPRNALTIYLIALCVVSVLCVFEYDEVIMLIIITEVAFTALLIYAHSDPTEWLYNQAISVFLLAGFYMISRYFFSYKASYYQQIIEIREKNVEIEKATVFKNQVLGTVAHDLRNPIGAVESIAMMMAFDDINDDVRENIGMIKESCIKARGIIDDLLEAAKNQNSMKVEPIRTEMNGFLRSLVNVWHIQKDFKSAVVFTSNNHEVFADIDVEKFQRVIDNLISNALKFSKDTDKVTVSLEKQRDYVTIRVQDQGLGIPADMIPNLFDSFTTAGRAGLRGEKSTGIGLSIVKQIVESHQGAISVDSVEGQGTTFIVMLPVAGK